MIIDKSVKEVLFIFFRVDYTDSSYGTSIFSELALVIVHELLHYVSRLLGGAMTNRELEENFAYSNSVPYLVENGYDDAWIAEKYLLPYYLGLEMSKQGSRLGHAHDLALERCQKIVKAAKGEAVERQQRYGYGGRFDFL